MSSHHARANGHGRHAVRDGASMVLSFFLALTLALAAIAGCVRFGMLSGEAFLRALDDDFYTYLQQYVNDQAYYYTLPTGIDPAVLEGIMTDGELRRDVTGHVYAAFDDHDYEAATEVMEEQLSENVAASFSADSVELTDDVRDISASYVSDVMDIYRDAVKLPGLEAIGSVSVRVKKYLSLGLAVTTLLAAALVVAIMRMHRYVHRGLRYLAYASGGAGMMLIIGPAILYCSGFHRRLSLSPQYFYHFGVSLVERLLLLCVASGCAFVVADIVLAVVVVRRRRHLINRGKHH